VCIIRLGNNGTAAGCKSRISGAVSHSRRGSFCLRCVPSCLGSRHVDLPSDQWKQSEMKIQVICGQSRGRGSCLRDLTRHRYPVQGCVPAEARVCATLRVNGTGSRAVPWRVRGGALVRRCAAPSKMRTVFEKCASWKPPMIPSKMRTLFQGAHRKLRLFAETVRRDRPVRRQPVWLPAPKLRTQNAFRCTLAHSEEAT
jgi:hypothetical protein